MYIAFEDSVGTSQ